MGTIPSNWQTGTVTGTFLDADFNGFVGKVIITPDVKAARVFGQAITLLKAQEFTLTAGTFTATLPAGNDPDVSPLNFTYTATIVANNGDRTDFPSYTFVLPVGQTVDLDQVTVVPPSSGLPNIVGGGSGGPTTADQITDATTTGKALIRSTSAADARTAIGAGTGNGSSNLAIGTTSTTAWAGDRHPQWTEVDNKPSTFTPSAHTHVLTDISGTTSTGQGILSAATPSAARTAIGITSVGSSIVTAADLAAAQNVLGILALVTAQLADAPRISYDSGYVPVDARPVLFFTQSQPALRSQDRWIADAAG